MEKYTYTVESGSVTLDVSANSVRENNDVFIDVTHGRGEEGYISVSGVENIKELILAIAVHGGLIDEGDALEISAPNRKLPSDGTYVLDTPLMRVVSVVEGGKLYIPQVVGPTFYVTGYLVDSTYYYERPDSVWTLIEMEKASHDHLGIDTDEP